MQIITSLMLLQFQISIPIISLKNIESKNLTKVYKACEFRGATAVFKWHAITNED